jgi:hypothetical protein
MANAIARPMSGSVSTLGSSARFDRCGGERGWQSFSVGATPGATAQVLAPALALAAGAVGL